MGYVVREGHTQHHGWNTDQQQTGQYKQGRGATLSTTNLCRQKLMHRVKRDRKNQPPQHQAKERRKNLHAHIDQYGNNADADQDLGQVFGQDRTHLLLFDFH